MTAGNIIPLGSLRNAKTKNAPIELASVERKILHQLMKKILLIIPSETYRTHDFMTAASRLKVEMVVASDHRQAMEALAPGRTLALNFHKPGSIAAKVREFARGKEFDAVVGVDDISAYIAAIAARALGVPQNTVESTAAARNKYLMRQKFANYGLNSPEFQLFPIRKNPHRLAKKVTYPCVLKPVFLSASRGVTRANNPEQFAKAFEEIKSLLEEPEALAKAFSGEAKNILVEDYIPGREAAVEGMLINREFKSLAIFDKPDPLEGPHFVETIYVTPSRLPAYVQREVIHQTHRAALALGLENGPIHAELRINENGVWPIEVAARSIGGLCSRVLQFQQGAVLEDLILRNALGESIWDIQREKAAAGVMMIPIPQAGVLQEIKGIEKAKAVPGIDEIIITIINEQKVTPMPRGSRYLGFIFGKTPQPEEVEAAIRRAHQQLEIVIR